MLSKINVAVIVRDHLATLYNARGGVKKISAADVVILFALPLVPAAVLPWRGVWLPPESIGTLITAMSVFGALLFNLLILVYEVSGREPTRITPARRNVRSTLIPEIYANVAFAVLVAITAIVFLLPSVISNSDRVRDVVSVFTYYLLGVFVLNLLLVLKRIHVLVIGDIGSTVATPGAGDGLSPVDDSTL